MNETTTANTVRPNRLYVMKQITLHVQPASWQNEYSGGDDCCLIVVTGGSGKLTVGGTGFHLEKGKCFLLAPAEAAGMKADADGLSFYRMTFAVWETAEIGSYKALSEAPPCHGDMQCQPFSQCIDYVEAIYRLRDAEDEMTAFDRHVRFQELLRFLFLQHSSVQAGGNIRKAVEQSIEQLGERYQDSWTVDQLAAAAHMTRWHYTRTFKEITGLNPLDYLNGMRIDRAKQLLLMTDDRLFDISHHVGFSNEYYFSRRFKQTVGISPGQYRRNHREGIRVFAPFLEDFLVALGITPVLQCSHALWGKQEYLGLQHVPVFDLAADTIEDMSGREPDFIILDGGMERWLSPDRWGRLAPTYNMLHRGEDWRSTLRTLADLLGRKGSVPDVIAKYEQKAGEARAALGRSVRGKTVACLRFSALGSSLYAGPEHGYTGPVLYKDLGLEPHPLVRQLTGESRKANITPEWLSRLDADHLFITFDKRHSSYEGEERKVLDSAEWRALPAVRNRHVYEVDFLTWMNYGVLSHSQKIDDVLRVLA
ncbi:helix-turn-helix domain-containing protein [Paenibacillus hodogayensis]|uniref:Helix-turn-helix domain-containing protein n=1 Tax=Paenibacillus hodogayensis TaxID=279208 RepID=A0ABV5VYT9_9BACL